jgi:excisionase family DNA binding protein
MTVDAPQVSTSSNNPIAVTVLEATRLSGLLRSKFYELMERGILRWAKVGRRRLVDFTSLQSLLRPTD